MSYSSPKWNNGSAPPLSAENMQALTDAVQEQGETLETMCNPNMLDNWYFGNPVNQRGQTSYTGQGYGIDRWKAASNTNIRIGDGFVTLFGSWDVRQLFEKRPKATYTFSLLYKNSTAKTLAIFFGLNSDTKLAAQSNNSEGLITGTGTIDDLKYVMITLSGSGSADLIAVKLELGSQQTLAHQDANGAWVLNEIPDYAEQLLKCQRYLRPAGTQFITSQASGNIYGSVVMINSYPMRAVPSIVNANYVGSEVREATGGVAGTITNVFTPSIYGSFTVQLSGTSMPNYVYIDPTGFNPLLSAEL